MIHPATTTKTVSSTDGAGNPQDRFSSTMWTVVMAALSGSQGARGAFESLCRTYWFPVYAYIRHRGYGPHDAEDLTQEFFRQMVNGKRLRSPDRTKGRFRAYLLAGVNGLLANEWHARRAAKRGGGAVIESLDVTSAEGRYAADAPGGQPPEAVFDRRWAMTVMEEVHRALREEYQASGRGVLYESIEGFLLTPLEKTTAASIAEKHGMTANALTVTVHRLRHRSRSLMRQEVAKTVGDPGDIEDEMKHLLAVLNAASSTQQNDDSVCHS